MLVSLKASYSLVLVQEVCDSGDVIVISKGEKTSLYDIFKKNFVHEYQCPMQTVRPIFFSGQHGCSRGR